jgi:hypothetical protein
MLYGKYKFRKSCASVRFSNIFFVIQKQGVDLIRCHKSGQVFYMDGVFLSAKTSLNFIGSLNHFEFLNPNQCNHLCISNDIQDVTFLCPWFQIVNILVSQWYSMRTSP